MEDEDVTDSVGGLPVTPEVKELLEEIRRIDNGQINRLEEALALCLEQEWIPVLRELAKLSLRKRRALFCVGLKRINDKFLTAMTVIQELGKPAVER